MKILIQDNDGHWYLIEKSEEPTFWKWIEAIESDEETELDFSENGVDGPHSVLIKEYEIQ